MTNSPSETLTRGSKENPFEQHRQVLDGDQHSLLLAAMAIDQLWAVGMDRLVHQI